MTWLLRGQGALPERVRLTARLGVTARCTRTWAPIRRLCQVKRSTSLLEMNWLTQSCLCPSVLSIQWFAAIFDDQARSRFQGGCAVSLTRTCLASGSRWETRSGCFRQLVGRCLNRCSRQRRCWSAATASQQQQTCLLERGPARLRVEPAW